MSTVTVDVRPVVTAPVAEANAADFRLLLRWLGAMLLIASALAACMATRMAVRATALELDATRSALSRAEIQHERLLVERSLLRDPGRLVDTAAALALVPPAASVSVNEVVSP